MPLRDAPRSKIRLVFYRANSGNEPVRDWLRGMERADRLEIGADLQRVQFRWPVGMPLCRALGNGLWEIRTDLPSGTTARVLICFHDGEIYALHGFIKKTRKTPAPELGVARRRKHKVEEG